MQNLDYKDLMTDDDLARVTGYKNPSKQAEALRAARVHFIPRPDGRPSLTWYSFNHPQPVAQNDDLGLDGFDLDAI